MRTAFASLLLVIALGITSTTLALNSKNGRTVRGTYTAVGNAVFSGVKVHYTSPKVRVSYIGRISGRATKAVLLHQKQISQSVVSIHGSVKAIKRHGQTFSAPATIRLSDNVMARGHFRGLIDHNERFSRFFVGKISGVKRGRIILRSR